MKKEKKALVVILSFFGAIVVIAAAAYSYGFLITVPKYDDQYFTSKYLKKYATAEDAFSHFVNALTKGDTAYYQEVLGREMIPEESKKFKPYSGNKPKIEKIDLDKNHAYIVTDNNWGMHFEKVKGRWVFSTEDWGVLIRDFFR